MDWFIIVVAALLLLIGTPIALAWWKLARRAAPYHDEPSKAGRKGADDGAEVIVLPTSSDPKRPR